jgi:hypothetical protein
LAILPIHSTVITPFGPKTNPLWPVGIYLFELDFVHLMIEQHPTDDFRRHPWGEFLEVRKR